MKKRKNEEFHGVEFRTRGSAYEALGFSPEESAVLEAKSILWNAIHQRILKKKLSTPELCRILDAQPSQVSDLRTRKVDKMTLDKLVKYARRLGIVLEFQTRIAKELHDEAA